MKKRVAYKRAVNDGISFPTMPVTIKTAGHNATKFSVPPSLKDGVEAFFEYDAAYSRVATKILASSFDPTKHVYPKQNGFVHTVLDAYNRHYNLIIRPDDVWISIITLFSFFVNANAEKLRSKFVAHDGKKNLILWCPPWYLEDYNYDLVATGMTELLQKDLMDKDFKDWILPAFSTTTQVDRTVCAITMMSSMKEYYNFTAISMCGIPSVTLDGTKKDWSDIQKRLDKLDEFGEDTQLWASLLRPVISKFIAAFDGEVDDQFWGHIASPIYGGSGSPTLGGWLTAFCAFTDKGKFIGRAQSAEVVRWGVSYEKQTYSLDGVTYPIIDQSDIPSGNVDVDLKIIDLSKKEFETVMVAGNMGLQATQSQSGVIDTVQNAPMWAIYLKGEGKKSNGWWYQ